MPREKLVLKGASELETHELMQILVQTGTKKDCFRSLSNKVLIKIQEEADYRDLTVDDLKEIDGIGPAKASIIIAGIEIGSRLKEQQLRENHLGKKITRPEVLADVFIERLGHEQKEYFYTVLLNTKHEIIGDHRISEGSLNSTIVHPREVYKLAVKKSAHAIIFVHNHPSGDTKPSREDVIMTERLVEAGKILGIEALDHLIIGGDDFLSLKREGLMQ